MLEDGRRLGGERGLGAGHGIGRRREQEGGGGRRQATGGPRVTHHQPPIILSRPRLRDPGQVLGDEVLIADVMGERFEKKWLMQLSLFPKKKSESTGARARPGNRIGTHPR